MNEVINKPLIYTKDGYKPVDELESESEWRDEPYAQVFSLIYKYEGEIVYQSGHVRMKTGQEIQQEQEQN